MTPFECLYFLDNFYLSIVEIKRLDMASNAPASEKFLWLRIDKDTMEISQLTFRSMDSAADIQQRYFEEGFLKFNATIATYIEKYNSAQHPLKKRGAESLETRIAQTIEKYLIGLAQSA